MRVYGVVGGRRGCRVARGDSARRDGTQHAQRRERRKRRGARRVFSPRNAPATHFLAQFSHTHSIPHTPALANTNTHTPPNTQKQKKHRSGRATCRNSQCRQPIANKALRMFTQSSNGDIVYKHFYHLRCISQQQCFNVMRRMDQWGFDSVEDIPVSEWTKERCCVLCVVVVVVGGSSESGQPFATTNHHPQQTTATITQTQINQPNQSINRQNRASSCSSPRTAP